MLGHSRHLYGIATPCLKYQSMNHRTTQAVNKDNNLKYLEVMVVSNDT